MSLFSSINNSISEILDNENHQLNDEYSMDIETNNHEDFDNCTLNNKQKIYPFPTKCCICGYICSGYVFYNVVCCDGCKHFFRRWLITRKYFVCKYDGTCELVNVTKKCKSCRFDKCLLMGMNVQCLRGRQFISLWEVFSLLEQRRRELANKGRYVKRDEASANVEQLFSIMQKSLFDGQSTKILNYLLFVEQNVRRIRISPTRVPDWHYEYSCKSLVTLLTRKENLIASSHEFLNKEQYMPEHSFLEFINKNGFFAVRPTALTDDLLLIVEIAKTMPFFYNLDLSDKIYQITKIALPILSLTNAYYSSRKESATGITTQNVPHVLCFSGEYYQGDET
uniref:Nuclear receptor domain-containing protein n=1 Tax=Meloidogyne hapla TaxID=6305 RepID=A0A1I8C2K8_MELHA